MRSTERTTSMFRSWWWFPLSNTSATKRNAFNSSFPIISTHSTGKSSLTGGNWEEVEDQWLTRATRKAENCQNRLISTAVLFLRLSGHLPTTIWDAWWSDDVATTLKTLIGKQLIQYPDYQVVLPGHSLGAGAAAIATLVLQSVYSNVSAYCFACPSCVSLNLLPRLQNCVNTVNNSTTSFQAWTPWRCTKSEMFSLLWVRTS